MSKETRTYSDRREYLKRAVIKRRKLVIQQAIAYKGGKCVLCGYMKCSRALVFHHLDPSQKDFGIFHKGYPDRGSGFKLNWTNVFWFVQIVTLKFMKVLRSFLEKFRNDQKVNCLGARNSDAFTLWVISSQSCQIY